MSALAGLFVKGGHHYRTIPDVIALLPRGMQHAADVAMKCVLRLKAKGKLDETATDKELARESERMAQEIASEKGVDYEGIRGWSPSLIQKGLHAVDVGLRKIGAPPLIERESGIGMRGRRQITIRPLAGREKGEKAADDPPAADDPRAGPPPAPPPDPEIPETEGTVETTTTGPRGSSSSLAPLPGTGPELPPPLLDVVGLLPDLSRERVQGWVALGGPELALRVAEWLRVWLLHPRAENRPRGAYWAEKALLEWRKKLDLGFLTMADIDQMIEAKRRKWAPRPSPAKAAPPVEEAPPSRLTAEQLAELVRQCQGGDVHVRRFSVALLRGGVESGEIPAELVPTIPRDLLGTAEPHRRE